MGRIGASGRRWSVTAKRAFWRAADLLGARAVRIRRGPAAGTRIVAPLRLWPSYARGAYEPHVQAALWTRLAPGGVALDVGGFLGCHGLVMAKRVGREGQVHVFEPVPLHAARLRRTAALNPALGISIVEAAVGAADGVAALHPQRNPAMTFVTAGETGGRRPEAEMIRLDSWVSGLPELPPVDLIKIDVEGHELAVLRGARRLIDQWRPHLVCEVHRQAHVPYRPAELVAWLTAAGYEVSPLPSPGREGVSLEEALDRLEGTPLAADRVATMHLLASPTRP